MGESSFLEDIQPCDRSHHVTFGDGVSAKVLGKGNLCAPGLPKLTNVWLVEGLKANLISISQLCDQNFLVRFTKNKCLVVDESEKSIMEGVRSPDNCYLLTPPATCLKISVDEAELWHHKLGHVNYRSMKKAVSVGALRGIPELKTDSWKFCGPCVEGKQVKVSHKVLQHLVTNRVLELLHMDLMGPMQVESIGGKRYAFVCVDDYSRFTWVQFIREKSDTFDVFKALCSRLQTEQCCNIGKIVRIRSDHGREFENAIFAEYCDKHGIAHEFSAPKTPEQNGVVERKNRTIQEMARVMLNAKGVSHRFWGEAMNTACYIINRVYLRPGTIMTPYEIWKGRKPTVQYFHVFGSTCYILNDREYRGKLDAKSDE